jgi:hypothetical protein
VIVPGYLRDWLPAGRAAGFGHATASRSGTRLSNVMDDYLDISVDSSGFRCLTESLEVKENVRLK